MIRMHSIEKELLEWEIKNGNIRMQRSPYNTNLAILNYTEQAQFAHYWTPLTRRCRGLVVDWPENTTSKYISTVIEAPEKFFNHTEPEAPDLNQWMFKDSFISEKLDGYYIAVRNDSHYGLIVTSRGSFYNQYVLAAKKLLPENIPQNVNYFCELCEDFPGDESIIVARYKKPRLVCWGVNDLIPTPQLSFGWGGEIAKEVTEAQLNQYLNSQNEGVVAYNRDTHERVKIKTSWYLTMHRLISNCTFNHTLEIVMGGGKINGVRETDYIDQQGNKQHIFINALPEEHLEQMKEWEREIWKMHAKVVLLATSDYDAWNAVGAKEYALKSTTPKDIKSIVFGMMNNKNPEVLVSIIWKVVKNRLLGNSTN